MIVPQRLTFLVIAIVWLSTSLISLQITARDVYALSFDASVIDYSAWMENQSTTTLFFHLKPNNISFSNNPSLPMATHFGLNVLSGTDVKDYHITNDLEFFAWLPANLGEIDLKRIPSPYYSYKSLTDLSDPSQIVIQKFTSLSLVIASIFIIMLFFVCAGLIFIDKFVFRTVLQNCFRLDKNISWERTKKEIRRFSKFFLKILILIVLYIVVNAILLFLCHEYIVPIPTVIKIFSAFDIDPVVWEENIEIGIFGDIGEEYERWGKAKGLSPETARFFQELLWNNWYIFIALILYFGFSFYLSVFKLSLGMFMHYKKEIIRRRNFYFSVDRHRLANNELDRSQPTNIDKNSENASK